MGIKVKLLLLILVGVAGLAGFLLLKNVKQFAGFNLLNQPTEPQIQSPPADTDNDGLSDDEENFYGTDPLRGDTDRDGFLDGEEIAAICNPLEFSNDCAATYKAPERVNLTERISNAISAAIASGDLAPGVDRNALLNNLATLTDGTILTGTQLFYVDDAPTFYVSQDNSTQALQIYVNELIALVEELLGLSPNFLSPDALSNNFGNSQAISLNYSSRISMLKEKLVAMTVPDSWQELHTEIIRTSRRFELFFEAMRNFNQDPMKTAFALQQYPFLSSDFQNLLQKVVLKISEQKIELPKDTLYFLLALVNQ